MEQYWKYFPNAEDIAKKLSLKLNVSPITAQILLNRGIKSLSKAQAFLNKENITYQETLPEENLTKACKCIEKHNKKSQSILVWGDYDVDGMTSTTLMVNKLRMLNMKHIHYYIPDRFSDGYGLNESVIDMIKTHQIDLLITLDCGISNIDIITKIKTETACDVMIIDHHTIPDSPPPADAIIHPKHVDENHPLFHLCTVGAVYHFWDQYGKKTNTNLNLENDLDLVAMGTIADIVPLTGANRNWTDAGLKKLNGTKRPGIQALLKQAKHNRVSLSTQDISFTIAPRLNAAGRLTHAKHSVELLLAETPQKAEKHAFQLEMLNLDRRKIGNKILESSIDLVEKKELIKNKVLILSHKTWHSGVIGITASKLVETYTRPTILIAEDDNICRGSARTSGNVNIYNLLKECKSHLKSFGGHKNAAGFSLKKENISLLKELIIKKGNASIQEEELKSTLYIDDQISPTDLTIQLVEDIEKLGPFGEKNPRPLFFCNQLNALSIKTVGNGTHVKATFTDITGQKIIDAIGFGLHHKMEYLNKEHPKLVFHLGINAFQGKRRLQLELIDIK